MVVPDWWCGCGHRVLKWISNLFGGGGGEEAVAGHGHSHGGEHAHHAHGEPEGDPGVEIRDKVRPAKPMGRRGPLSADLHRGMLHRRVLNHSCGRIYL